MDTPLPQAVLDSLKTAVALLGAQGEILFVNRAWREFGAANGSDAEAVRWDRVNYLQVCSASGAAGDHTAQRAEAGINSVLKGERAEYTLEYPCHGPDEQRWFLLRVTPLHGSDTTMAVVSHENITDRILAEQRLVEMNQRDVFKRLPDRTQMEHHFRAQGEQARRSGTTLALLWAEVKPVATAADRAPVSAPAAPPVNATRELAQLMRLQARGPADLAARWSDTALLVLLSGLDEAAAAQALAKLRRAAELRLPGLVLSTSVCVLRPGADRSAMPGLEATVTHLAQLAAPAAANLPDA